MRDEIRNLMPSAAEPHRAHHPMTTTDADSHCIALHNDEALLGRIQPTIVHLANSTRPRRAATNPDPLDITQAQQHRPHQASWTAQSTQRCPQRRKKHCSHNTEMH